MCQVDTVSYTHLDVYKRQTVKEGEFVNEGQIIAAAPGVASVDFVYAPMSGVVEKICTLTGTITIARVIKHIEVLAHIPGVVKSLSLIHI